MKVTPAMLAELVRLHDAVAARAHDSPTIRLMIGDDVLDSLKRIRYLHKQESEAGVRYTKQCQCDDALIIQEPGDVWRCATEGCATPATIHPEPVILESPYAGDVERNLAYVRACMRDSLLRGEAPFPSHALYTQPGVLDDTVPDERERGIRAGFVWRLVARRTVVYTDLGISGGMQRGIDHAVAHSHEIEYRKLGGGWST